LAGFFADGFRAAGFFFAFGLAAGPLRLIN
jgi:hypothetical protein